MHAPTSRPRPVPLARLLPLVCSLALAALVALAPAQPALARWLLPRGGTVVVAGTWGASLVLHAAPGADQPVVASVPEGTELTVSGAPVWAGDGLYYPVRHPSGVAGWAFDLYLAAGRFSIFSSGFSIQARVTGYSDGPEGGALGFLTRTSTVTRWGVAAVDPSVIPLGARLLIQGLPGVYQAEDTGSGVVGRWVDVWFPTPEAARAFGVHDGVVVTVLGW